jgi:hypothetical protein
VELIGLYFVAAALLVGAGIAKTIRPGDTARALGSLPGLRRLPLGPLRNATRVGAAAEAALGLVALVAPGPVTGGLVAASYFVFAAVTAVVRVRGGALSSCGCFGRPDTPASWLHVLLDLVFGVAAVAVAMSAAASASASASVAGTTTYSVLAHEPWAGVPLVFASAVGAWLTYLAMAPLAVLESEVRRLGRARGEVTS